MRLMVIRKRPGPSSTQLASFVAQTGPSDGIAANPHRAAILKIVTERIFESLASVRHNVLTHLSITSLFGPLMRQA